MIILGIETSCDETAAAVLEQKNERIQILSNVVASSASLQAKYGGIIPEQAAREQLKSIIPVITEALEKANLIRHPGRKAELAPLDSGSIWIPDQLPQGGRVVRNDKVGTPQIDAIAVTYGPGLIGSLLVGVETAKVLAKIWDKPLIPVNHLLGHFYANWIAAAHLRGEKKQLHPGGEVPKFPCLGLLVSGGHTDLVLFQDHNKYKYLGGTRDDAAGECFDKCARLLGLPYPGGPEISKLASQGDALKFKLPVPMLDSKDFDFSFSGLKTAVANLLSTSEVDFVSKNGLSSEVKRDLAAAIENAIVTCLVEKVARAAQKYDIDRIIVAGGVAANLKLKQALQKKAEAFSRVLYIPPPELCTDNAAMIASAAFFQKKTIDPLKLQANPNLSLS